MERGKRINKKTEIFIYLETNFSYVALACLELTAVFLPEHLLPHAGITGAMYLKLYEILKRIKELQQAFGLLWLHSNRQSSKFLELQMAVMLVLGLKLRSSRRAVH